VNGKPDLPGKCVPKLELGNEGKLAVGNNGAKKSPGWRRGLGWEG